MVHLCYKNLHWANLYKFFNPPTLKVSFTGDPLFWGLISFADLTAIVKSGVMSLKMCKLDRQKPTEEWERRWRNGIRIHCTQEWIPPVLYQRQCWKQESIWIYLKSLPVLKTVKVFMKIMKKCMLMCYKDSWQWPCQKRGFTWFTSLVGVADENWAQARAYSQPFYVLNSHLRKRWH